MFLCIIKMKVHAWDLQEMILMINIICEVYKINNIVGTDQVNKTLMFTVTLIRVDINL